MCVPKTTVLLLLLCSIAFCAELSGTDKNMLWVPDNRDGTYTNPVIFADYSDPDVIRVNDNFYMTASSFNCVPGLPILQSEDLINWKLIGHAIERFADKRFDAPQHGNGIWAPSIRYHDSWFWIFYGDPDAGIFMTKARDPAGPWEPIHLVHQGKGLIDPCPLWDDDGKAYLVHAWAKSRAGINSILTVHRMSYDGMKLLDEGTMVFDGRGGIQPTIEGPKFYKRNGYYYILAPAGGVKRGWQLALRSKNVMGPYEAKRVLEQGTTNINGPHQGGWVELKSGQSWFIHFQDRGAYGRVVHLNPMRWVDDWPMMGVDLDGNGVGEPVSEYKKPDVGRSYPIEVPQTSDEFNADKLTLQWQWHANPKNKWMSLIDRSGWLRLYSVLIPENAVNLWSVPNLLLQKFPAPEFTVTTKLDFSRLAEGEKAGLIVMGMDYSYIAVERKTSGFRVIKITCTNANKNGKETEQGPPAGRAGFANCSGDSLLLRVEVNSEAICQLSYSSDGKKFSVLGEPFTARAGRWIGTKVGLFCLAQRAAKDSGYAEFDWFRFE
jgi:beta-xylosidase